MYMRALRFYFEQKEIKWLISYNLYFDLAFQLYVYVRKYYVLRYEIGILYGRNIKQFVCHLIGGSLIP